MDYDTKQRKYHKNKRDLDSREYQDKNKRISILIRKSRSKQKQVSLKEEANVLDNF